MGVILTARDKDEKELGGAWIADLDLTDKATLFEAVERILGDLPDCCRIVMDVARDSDPHNVRERIQEIQKEINPVPYV